MTASCPACNPAASTSWSGAIHDLARASLPRAEHLYAASSGNYPEVDLYRCGRCGALWELEHSYPDRPPYMARLSRLAEEDLDLARRGDVEAFLELAARRGPYVSLRGLLLGIALNADADTRARIRAHPALPERVVEAWDRLVRFGVLPGG